MYWIFIVNDLLLGDITLSADDITTYLLKSSNWQYSKFAPNINKLKKGDTVLVYLAGKGRRYFVASFTLNGCISILPNTEDVISDWELEFNRLYQLTSPIDNIQVYNNPIDLNEKLRTRLDFIVDKKNWGLYFRLGIRALPEKDFETITLALKDKN